MCPLLLKFEVWFVQCACKGSLCVHVGWLPGASGATEWLTSQQMLLHIDEAVHLIINPHCVITPTNVCVSLSLSLFPNSVFSTVFHLTKLISPWTTFSRSQTGGLWSALSGCKRVVLLFFFNWGQNVKKQTVWMRCLTSLWCNFL